MPPALIVALVLVGLVVLTYLFGLRPDPVRGRRPTPGILKRRSKWRRWLPIIPLVAAVGCLVLAFSGFRFSFRETPPTIVLVMDVSRSMDTRDVAPNRLAAAEAAAVAFLDELPADFQVGLVTFSETVTEEVAPTQEREAVVDALARLETSQETFIGDGLDRALDSIEGARGTGRSPAAAVLLSDGRDTGSSVTPAQAAERARSMGVPVFTVVVGQVSDTQGAADLTTLEEIAATSGGETFTAETANELTTRYENLGSELSVDLEAKPFSTPLVIAAIGLVIVSGFILVLTPR